jgi:hypothetical protein
MNLIFGNISDKTFGWLILGSLVLLWAIILPVTLAIDSRVVFGVISMIFSAWLLIIATRLIQMQSTFIGWGIISSFALFLLLSFFTTRGVPLIYITMIFTGWAGYKLVRLPARAPQSSPAS